MLRSKTKAKVVVVVDIVVDVVVTVRTTRVATQWHLSYGALYSRASCSTFSFIEIYHFIKFREIIFTRIHSKLGKIANCEKLERIRKI